MSLAFKRFKVYLRTLLSALVVVVVGLVLFKNRNHEVAVWFFWLTDPDETVNVVWVMLCTALATLAIWWVVSRCVTLLREVREVRRLQLAKASNERQKARAAELDERERRLDEKIERAITDEHPAD